ncbi:DUF1642 domain-containing protein [Lactococcus lactis subsp. lactis]|uniref:DUF1642 domain-containing protein n=1 Tax=Lactococcus lactis TaxID=1358 RepID=UPI001BAF608E|nr:DUF1642 domain-containing protein [Lactococcus lactis]MBS3729601.1 DUF1642 domain-containing protein [Lactococcus lactis subsp. lactis]
MTKFEEELFNKVKVTNIELTTEAEYKKSTLINHFKNWHSDEEFQELFDKYSNLNDHYEKEVIKSSKLESQIIGLKSQLQQQALPVVPEDVAKWIECVKGKNNNALALLDDDNMPDDVNEWLFFQRNDDNINLILRAWLDGYTVEKPQLFYLKNKLTGFYLFKAFGGKYGEEFYRSTINLTDDFKFTQQEIDSMQTGSYELVPVEDGE